MTLKKCERCGEPTAEELSICPACMEAAGASPEEVKSAEKLRDIARVLSVTADTDANIKEAMKGILNIADRLERGI